MVDIEQNGVSPATAGGASAPALKPPSERQREILPLVAEGLTNAEIGRRLHLSENTVKTHLDGLSRKWGVSKRGALVWAALREGFLPCPCPHGVERAA